MLMLETDAAAARMRPDGSRQAPSFDPAGLHATRAGAQPRPGATQVAAKQDHVPKGILFMVLATVMLAASNAIAKWQVAVYPVGEVMFFRSFFSLVFLAAGILPF